MAALPPLASIAQLAVEVGMAEGDLEGDPRAAAALSKASSLVRAYTKQTFEVLDDEEVPTPVQEVTLDVAARVWVRRPGDDTESRTVVTGPFSDTARAGGGGTGLYLSTANKLMLAEYRVGAQAAGIGVIATTRGDDYPGDTIYVPTGPPPSGNDFPWYDADDPLLNP